MPGSFAQPLPPAPLPGRDVVSPAAALALALVGTKAKSVTVVELAHTLGIRNAPRPPKPGKRES